MIKINSISSFLIKFLKDYYPYKKNISFKIEEINRHFLIIDFYFNESYVKNDFSNYITFTHYFILDDSYLVFHFFIFKKAKIQSSFLQNFIINLKNDFIFSFNLRDYVFNYDENLTKYKGVIYANK
ncbi:hypothetical protein CPIN18021_0305 [Campylobacter pinnipediorum subsp. caledonicus]|uniref:Uncharacterized protein n=1 Tax=Campylobacter pinnipediorum subsp. caledonicus TaxID=1874362 RepID=A0A1S6U637_9BACT|nr:hypothetical protein CPIN18020_0289 [Campylobacter pinnipediorum subsp. caledonicus]AQW87152.1 hypothetical protein CPIN18021_0305 [Campylobacter pinnipediorum subsp. caledonicus]OPA72026.1 hypothetical protein BB381_00290 [Campylobacter pinnipediorum subsp. caledonicus]